MDKLTCINCKYCEIDELKDMICVNDNSDYCTDYVDAEHSCCEHELSEED